MLALQAQNQGLYFALILCGTFLIIAALGPGLFEHSIAHPFSWQYQIFNVLCHQDAARSFHFNAQQMAVCSRCFGIYSSFLTGWLFMPLLAYFRQPSKKKKKIFLIAAILLNSVDVIGNYFSFWSNTLNSRFLLGTLVGLAVVFFLAENFFKSKKSEY